MLTQLVAQSFGLLIGATVMVPKTAQTITTVIMLGMMLVRQFPNLPNPFAIMLLAAAAAATTGTYSHLRSTGKAHWRIIDIFELSLSFAIRRWNVSLVCLN